MVEPKVSLLVLPMATLKDSLSVLTTMGELRALMMASLSVSRWDAHWDKMMAAMTVSHWDIHWAFLMESVMV
jgi:hypothetical protein